MALVSKITGLVSGLLEDQNKLDMVSSIAVYGKLVA